MMERCVEIMDRGKALLLGRKTFFFFTLSVSIISFGTFFHQPIGTYILKPDKTSTYNIDRRGQNCVFLTSVESLRLKMLLLFGRKIFKFGLI